MKLTKLKVENFKRIQSVEIDLSSINILVGSNGSGKSSIIQAIHLACCMIRQAYRIQDTTSTVGIDELDYLPSNDYKRLAHYSEWGNKTGSPSSKVALTFVREENQYVASCEIRSARNAGISITGSVPNELTDSLRKKLKFFSAYIPGISGIPNREEKRSKKVIMKACSYGDSNIYLRNVLLLLSEMDGNKISLIETWISDIVGPIKITVIHKDDRDLFIECNITIGTDTRPIELIGTGYLQLIQIFSYILLFAPGILLIDEPDIHLHPTVQEKLVKVLAKVAREKNLRILLTTHSPFVVRGAPPDAKVYWINEGEIESKDRRAVELALGWGAFGKKVIIISEDSITSFLEKIVSQWPGLERFVTYFPGTGYNGVTTPAQAAEIIEALGSKYKILVHRDRDSLTDEEVAQLKHAYEIKGITLWFTDFSDLEAYFCQSIFLQNFLGCSEVEACTYVDNILSRDNTPIKDQFESQRAGHNEELHKAGGSPHNSDVWASFQTRFLKGAKGKYVFKQLKACIPRNAFREEAILNYSMTVEIAPSLKQVLEQLLA